MANKTPQTMPHEFTLPLLHQHFRKTPNTPGANALINLPPTVFLDTEEDINVIGASLYILCVKFDQLEEDERPKDKDGLRRWIAKNRLDVIGGLLKKIEPPLHAWSVDQIQRDVAAMLEDLLVKLLPEEKKEEADGKERAKGDK
ncbi:hypothetical protein P7C73_g2231, partial [Tremellales sp. Uapishka_1]